MTNQREGTPEQGGPYNIPPAIYSGLRKYRDHGIPQGGFLQSVLESNLIQALGRADEHSMATLHDIVRWCYWNLPANMWGSAENYAAHLEKFSLHRKMVEALKAVLMFHSSHPWDDQRRLEWQNMVGRADATNKNLCDFVRETLSEVESCE